MEMRVRYVPAALHRKSHADHHLLKAFLPHGFVYGSSFVTSQVAS